tara:strand:+ start:790 stop:1497 length:708 start_codon:yes stop_codon:yes gene_type:complete
MINKKDVQNFYFAIVGQNLHINYFSSRDNNSNYQKKYLMPDTLGNNLNLVIVKKFISEKIKDFEKNVGSFIEKINVITDAQPDQYSFSLKNKFDTDKIKETDVVRLLSDAKQQIIRNNKESAILHLIVDKYIVDGEEYLEFPENINYKEFVVEVSFITIQNTIVKTLNKIFKDCNIEVKKIISHQYSSRFSEKTDTSPCIAGKKVVEGINPSEVIIYNLYSKKQGFFEKMFNFFS